jgi:hypothetical protein
LSQGDGAIAQEGDCLMQVLLFYLMMLAVERRGYPTGIDLSVGAFFRALIENV